MYRNILVAVDGSPAGLHALKQTFPLARAEKGIIRVISVVPPYQGELRLTGVRGHVTDLLREPCEKALAEASSLAQEEWGRIEIILEEGDPHERIVETAEAMDCDLVVLGVRGNDPAETLLMAGMTARVIGYGHTDVLVIPAERNFALDRILLAVGDSGFSERATGVAFAFHKAYGSRLTVISIADVPSHIYGVDPSAAQDWIEKARKNLRSAEAAAKAQGITADMVLREGDPASILTAMAEEMKAGMIVIGSHGRTGLKRLLMGSVTQRVIGSAPCPVLVARN